ncbi:MULTISPECIES: stage III sporulation protein AC [unclassified Clostridium]|jgi:stage III sporulation protein AC|uniref:stage III sporulation protein AC n=1 Tax=unclassified Clostridium TaxID=2614128 RepID=UPI0025BB1FB3|nr:stage III sporulation protein AC [Clostridium sp.]MCI6692978.1 stage III sporulation protein AC [Clostridium sp.]MDY2630181.1 stage III sporulation protein AC [Clostridium sp.]MDY4251741.1 stage III sporulation protein AC [Clostridium sp.]MDY6226282.1 stage III sporulation protein AC [Clostridium sp.]
MLDINILFKIGAMGVLLVVIDKVLKASGKDDIAVITNIAGIVIILITVIGLISNLFNTVKTMFML